MRACVCVCTLSLLLGFVAELQVEVGALTEAVAGQWEEGLQQGQAGLKVRPEGVLGHSRQPGGEHSGRERGDGARWREKRMRWREK